MTVFNPLAQTRTSVVNTTLPNRAAAPGWVVFITGDDGPVAVAAQFDAFDTSVVHFVATIPALGFAKFDCVPCGSVGSVSGCEHAVVDPVQTNGAATIKSPALSLNFSGGLLSGVTQTATSESIYLTQELMMYVNGVGGAYILIETGEAEPLPAPVRVRTITGPVLTEVVQEYRPGSGGASSLQQRFRLYQFGREQHTIEVTQMIGTGAGKRQVRELVSRYRAEFGATMLQTDSTGFEDHERAADPRGIGANYHAMTQRASLVETTRVNPRQLALLTTHTMGAASLAPGNIEHMLIRRLNTTDNQGA